MTPALDPRSARVLVVLPIVLAMLSMIGPFSIDTPFPAFDQMRDEFEVEAGQLQLVVTVYMLSFAAMSIFHGPLSDALGRRPVIIGSVSVYVVASVGCALAPSLGWLLVGRAVQGLSAGGSTIVSRTVIRDVFDGPQAQRLMSRVAMIFGLAPAIAPIVGGGLLQLGPWHLVFWFMGVLGLVLVAATLFVLPETHPPSARVPLRVGEILRGIGEVVRQPAFHRVAWASTFVFGAQFLYIGGAAIFVVDVLGEGELDFWKLFVPMIGAMVLGSWVSGRTAGIVEPVRLVTLGFAVALVGASVGVAVSLTGLGNELPWAVVGVTALAFGNGLGYPILQLMMLDLLPMRRGAMMSGATFVTLVFNAMVAVAVTPYVGSSALGFSLTALALVVLGALCWAWHRRALARGTVPQLV
ncbi:multidrug effflux MFS transporter [Nocardioides jensenii]|uniref:multidrug effflux MFS transporter n=1 Tax=Nocardioides jensenii TaxID=1843 RepID=UPI001C3F3B51|nr:multidrug effflux MFS transporter [Nocardioides jensenii]